MSYAPKIYLLTMALCISIASPDVSASEAPTAAVIRGYELIVKGSYPQAIAVLIEDLRYKPDNFQARRYLSFAFHQIGMSTKAAQQMEIVTRRDPGNANDLALLGDMYVLSGDNSHAITAFKGCLSIAPEHRRARCGLLRALVSANDCGSARIICLEELKTCRHEGTRKQLMQILSRLQMPVPAVRREARG